MMMDDLDPDAVRDAAALIIAKAEGDTEGAEAILAARPLDELVAALTTMATWFIEHGLAAEFRLKELGDESRDRVAVGMAPVALRDWLQSQDLPS